MSIMWLQVVTPTVISTFAGTGGSSLGYKWAGYKELLAVDFDKHAHQCFKLNFPEVPAWHRDIKTVTAKEILDYCNLEVGELDLLDGSPPCQGFSTAGKREVNDNRNDLFKDYIRLIEGLRPKVFVMENVTGMIKGKMKGRFLQILSTLKALDYNVKAKKMNSANYGVPQSRERIMFIGVRSDLGIHPVFPSPMGGIVSVKKTISGIENIGLIKGLTNDFLVSKFHMVKPGESYSKQHSSGSYFSLCKAHWDKPVQTIIKTPTIIHPYKKRYLSINECKLLCSFPIEWKLGSDFTSAWNRLGNAVMPKFMQAIAETIKKEIIEKHYEKINNNVK